jgi:fructokinase
MHATVIGLGELLWDVFPDGRRPGGAPANFAFQAGQLGARGLVATRVGTDPDGDELLAFLNEKGIDTSAVQRDPEHPTGKVTVSFNAAGQPEYVIHESVAWDYLEPAPTLEEAMRSADAVCFGTLAQRSETSRRTIQHVLGLTAPDCLRVYDVNLRQNYYHRDWIEASLQRASIVKLNDDEVAALASLLGLSADQAEFSRQVIGGWGPRMVCITRGADGCLVVAGDEVHDIPGRPVSVADTVGSGDAFTAGLIHAQLHGWSVEASADFANRVGGLVASRQGAMPDLRDDYRQLLSEFVTP